MAREFQQDADYAAPERFRIGDLAIDTGKLQVSRDGEVLDIAGLSFDLFLALAKRAPNVVTHDELVEAVWPGRVITPETITQRVKLVRQALGDDADDPTYIGLVRNRGYRLLVDVEHLGAEPETVAQALFAELGRRRVLQFAVVYAAVAWSITEVLSFLIDALPVFPEGSRAFVAILFVVGFPVAMFLAWRFDIGPKGIRRTKAISRRDHFTVAVAILLLVGATAGLFYLIYPRVVTTSTIAGPVDIIPNSIAVLPFSDLSPDGDQAYFAEGIAEEILNRLTSVDGIAVFGSSQSFRYNMAGLSPVEFARQLAAAFTLDGSVRKQGDALRISVNLIETATALSIWTQTYDRELLDIFAIQEDIAESVTSAVSIAASVEDRGVLPGAGTDNLEAFDAMLAGRALDRVGRGEDAIVFFERARDLDPEYAHAWVEIANSTLTASWDYPPDRSRAMRLEAAALLEHALELDPGLPDIWYNFTGVRSSSGDFVGAAEADEQRRALTPGALDSKQRSAGLLSRVGRTREALAVRETDARGSVAYYGSQAYAEMLIHAERYDDARAALDVSERVSASVSPWVILRRMFIAMSDENREAVRELLQAYGAAYPPDGIITRPVLAEFDAPGGRITETLREVFANEPDMTPDGRILTASLAAFFGDPALAAEVLWAEMQHNTLRVRRLWYPVFSDMRKLPAFRQMAEDIGLVAYWRAYGWPDVCRPLSDTDFECW